ncbi:hemicentin-1 [Oryzias latipes]
MGVFIFQKTLMMNKLFSVLFFLIHVWILTRGDAEVSCQLGQSCILPCSFTPGDDPAIHWIQLTLIKAKVHSYHDNKDHWVHQDQRFRGRTSLFKDQISKGNASLQLTGVMVQDEGRYQCFTSTITHKNTSLLTIRIECEAEVYCQFGQSCILPCSFTPGDDLVIHWMYWKPTQAEVHYYYLNKDHLEHQHQRFRGRTSLFQDQFSKGNASLQLTGVMVQDEGGYNCLARTIADKGGRCFTMKVYAPPQKINMKQTENQIICSSDGIYPEPDLSWSISPPSSRTFQNTTRVQETEELLYNISSSLTLSDGEDDLDYICTISTPSNQRRASWRRGHAEVSCQFGQSCILPCRFTPGDDLVIHWFKMTPTNTKVHSYYDNKDHLEHQHQRFRGRTSLFQNQISKGNASLQLTGVMVQDEGPYRCLTSTITETGEFDINMKVYAPPQKINMKQTENQIICSSDGIYPEPDLSWSISPPSSRTFQNTTRVQKTEELLYNIRSSLTLSDREDDLDYICTISTPSNQRRASWRRGHAEVSCQLGQSCILPCSFTPGDYLEIYWVQLTPTQAGFHSYYDNKDHLEHQHQRFRGRTSLFQDQISKGNASLQLTGVKVQDEGSYKCFTRTITDVGGIYINMKVYAPPQKINMKQTENQIICSSDGIYPEPDLSWSISPPSSRTFQNTTRVQETEELLYNISSSLTLSDGEDDLDYICTISTPSNQRRASWRRGPSVKIISGEATISCSASDSSLKGFSLVWSFNQNQMIVTKKEDDEQRVSEEWKQHVKDVSESGRLTLQHLSADHEGTYTCEVSKDEETNITQVSLSPAEESNNPHVTIIIVLTVIGISAVVIALVFFCRRRRRNGCK